MIMIAIILLQIIMAHNSQSVFGSCLVQNIEGKEDLRSDKKRKRSQEEEEEDNVNYLPLYTLREYSVLRPTSRKVNQSQSLY